MAGDMAGIEATTQDLSSLTGAVTALSTELMNLRATYLFSAFAMMAMAQMIRVVTEKFEMAKQNMITAWSDIEFQAAKVSTVLYGTGEAIGSVTEEMMRLGRETEWTAVEAGAGMEVLSRAGLEQVEVFGAIEPVLAMATANNMDVAEAARFAAGAYRGWNLAAEESRHVQENITMVISQVTHAARRSRQEVTELAEAFRYVTAASETVGWSMEEVISGLMVAADSMISAGMAGRSFRRVMTRLGTIAGDVGTGIEQSRKVVRNYGIQLQTAEGDVVSFIDLIKQLEEVTKDLNTVQKVNLYQQLAGMRGMNALAAAVDAGSDALERNVLELKMSTALQAVFTEYGVDSRKQMIKWRKEIEGQTDSITDNHTALDDLTEKMGFSYEVALAIDDALTDNTVTWEEWTEALSQATIVSEMTAARLETLKGTQILLASSMEAMWAELASGAFAQVMEWWNKTLRRVADLMSMLPEPMKIVIISLILIASAFGKIIPPMLMFGAMITIQKAALASLNLEAVKMYELKLQNNTLTQEETTSLISNTSARLLQNGSTRDAITVKKLEGMTVQELTAWQDENTNSNIENAFAAQAQAEAIKQKSLATKSDSAITMEHTSIIALNANALKSLTLSYWDLYLVMGLTMGVMFLITHAMMTGNRVSLALAVGLATLAIAIKLVKKNVIQLDMSVKSLAISIGAATGGFTIALMIMWNMDRRAKLLTATVFGLAAATAILAMWFGVLNVSTGGLFFAVGVLAAAVAMLLDYFFKITEKTDDLDEALVGNTLFVSLMMIVDALKHVGKAVGWLLNLFGKLWEGIEYLSDKFMGLADLSIDLMGNSVIPESFERGASRIKDALYGVGDEFNIGGARAPTNKYVSATPRFDINLSDLTIKRELEPEELENIIEDGISQALRSWDRRMARM